LALGGRQSHYGAVARPQKDLVEIPGLLGKLKRRLRAERYDTVLDAQGLLKSALLSRLAGIPVFGFDAETAREPLAARLYQRLPTYQWHACHRKESTVGRKKYCDTLHITRRFWLG